MPSAKIVGNMIEWHRPTRISAHMAIGPCSVAAPSITTNAAAANVREHLFGRNAAHDEAADEAAHHHPAPQQHQIIGGRRLGHVADVRLRDKVDEQIGDADLGDQVDEDRGYAEHQVAVVPQRQVLALLGVGAAGVLAQGRQVERAMTTARMTSTTATMM